MLELKGNFLFVMSSGKWRPAGMWKWRKSGKWRPAGMWKWRKSFGNVVGENSQSAHHILTVIFSLF